MRDFSKALSWLLRHGAQEEGVPIRADAFCYLDDVMETRSLKKFNATLNDVNAVVQNDNKGRFDLIVDPENPDQFLIRAAQGHSMTVVKNEELLEPITADFGKANNVFQFK